MLTVVSKYCFTFVSFQYQGNSEVIYTKYMHSLVENGQDFFKTLFSFVTWQQSQNRFLEGCMVNSDFDLNLSNCI